MDPTTTQVSFLKSLSAMPPRRQVGVALHLTSAERLRDAITESAYPAGIPLPPEKELASALGISRPTLRQALSRLARQGVVHPQRGIGSFVLSGGIVRTSSLASLYEDLVREGRRPTATVLALDMVEADEDVSAALGVRVGLRLLHLRRIRYADDVPVALIDTKLAVPNSFTVTRTELESDGLYRLLRRAGLEPVTGHASISARLATADEAEHLKLPLPAAVMTANRCGFDAAGRGIEAGITVYPAGTEYFLPELGRTTMRPGQGADE